MSYEYSRRDLLTDPPEHYMYAPYRGRGFLDDWRRSRFDWLAALPEAAPPPAPAALPPAACDAPLTLLPWLRGWGVAALAGKPLPPGVADCVDLLARRFEIRKRLYRDYRPGLRVGERVAADPLAYPLLAWLLVAAFPELGLRRLNTLLKLGDIVVSRPPPGPEWARLAARRALRGELAAVERLLAGQGVGPDG